MSRREARINREIARKLKAEEKTARFKERVVDEIKPRSEFTLSKSARAGADPNSIWSMQMTFDMHSNADRQGSWSWGQVRNWCSLFDRSGGNDCVPMATLHSLKALSWAEIDAQASGGHKKHHSHVIEDLIPEVYDRWIEIGREEEEIFRFRTSGAGRFWGYRLGSKFYAVWWDPEHKFYPVEK